MKECITHNIPLIISFFVLINLSAYSQDTTSLRARIPSFPDKVFNRIDKESSRLGERIAVSTDRYLANLEKREHRLYKKMWRKDSLKAKEIFGDVSGRYASLREEVRAVQSGKISPGTPYVGKLDSISTAIKFLQEYPPLQELLGTMSRLESGMQRIKGLQQNLNAAELLRNRVSDRMAVLKVQLQNTPLVKQFRIYGKEVYYYQQQVNAYRQALNDPEKLGPVLLQAAQKIPAFKSFFGKHSELANMFSFPGGDGLNSAPSLAGLQTRADVQSLFQQRFGYSPAIGQQLQQSLQSGQDQLQGLKEKALQNINTGGSGTDELDFRPNNQKAKSFKERLEFGTNMQSQKQYKWFPVTSDLGLSIGYKLNDKSTIGTGISYKLGWGESIRRIKFSHQGVGLRSFIDWKIKGSFWLSGGYEMNFNSEVKNLEQLKAYSPWQRSGLLGLSKVVSLKSRLLSKTTVQLMWDFLSYQQIPRTQPIVFRTGYSIR